MFRGIMLPRGYLTWPAAGQHWLCALYTDYKLDRCASSCFFYVFSVIVTLHLHILIASD